MTTWYVAANGGSDSNAGTSSGSAFATLQKAANLAGAGDTVEVMGGTYTSGFSIARSGTSSAPITFEAAAGQHPVISAGGQWAGIDISGASWITIKGFEVAGGAQSVSLSYAQSQESNTSNPITAGNGIIIHGSSSTHDVIEGNYVHDWSGGGIVAGDGDYFSILNNVVTGNAHWSPYANSGISLGFLNASDSSSAYHNVISGNTVHDNAEYIPFKQVGYISDGNGIIIDSDNNSGYGGRTLVSNNLSYHNGGNGIQDFDSDHTDILYNTTYQNDQNVNKGEIGVVSSNDAKVENNILVAAAGMKVDTPTSGTNVIFDYNVYSGGTPASTGSHSIVADPQFVAPGNGDFSLQATSPAIDKANSAFPSSTDIAGNTRPSGAGYDIGAFEFGGTITPPPPPPPPSIPPSPDGTKITSASDAPIIDQSGNQWSLIQSASDGLQIAVNGKVDPITGNVVLLETLGGKMVQENAAGEWYSESSPTAGWTRISDPSTTVPPDKLVLSLSEDAYRGDAQFIAKVDGVQIAGPTSVTALHRQGQTQDFTYQHAWGAGIHQVEIDFINDAYGGRATRDRNLWIDKVNYDGTSFGATPNELTSNGAFVVTVGHT